MTIKPEYLDNILLFCRMINPNFLCGEEYDLPLFESADNFYQHTLNSLRAVKVTTWKEFEDQLTQIIQYKMLIMYFAVSSYFKIYFSLA